VALTYVSNPDQAKKTVQAAQALGVKALAIQADTAGRGGGCGVPFTGGAVYAMSKAALVGLVKGLARDLGPRASQSTTFTPVPWQPR
jgi:3-oxoacyl-[acyl-carrier protein] reductase